MAIRIQVCREKKRTREALRDSLLVHFQGNQEAITTFERSCERGMMKWSLPPSQASSSQAPALPPQVGGVVPGLSGGGHADLSRVIGEGNHLFYGAGDDTDTGPVAEGLVPRTPTGPVPVSGTSESKSPSLLCCEPSESFLNVPFSLDELAAGNDLRESPPLRVNERA